MWIITAGLITCFLGTWVGMQVMACKNKPAPPPPAPGCTDGDTFKDDFVKPPVEPNKTEDAERVVPSTVYIQVLVVMDPLLYTKIGKTYKNGQWSTGSRNSDPQIEAEVKLYVRKFMSAVNIKFQGQFKNPNIKFVLRDVFKVKTCNIRENPYVTWLG